MPDDRPLEHRTSSPSSRSSSPSIAPPSSASRDADLRAHRPKEPAPSERVTESRQVGGNPHAGTRRSLVGHRGIRRQDAPPRATGTSGDLPTGTSGDLLSPRSLQLCLGFIWLFVGVLQLQPFMFSHGFVTEVILPNAVGQPAAVAAPITTAAHLMTRYPVLLNSLFAAVQLLIGVTIIRLAWLERSTVRLVLLASMVWAFSVWWIGEGFGGLLTGTASPLTGAPGAVILYALLAYLAWPHRMVGNTSSIKIGHTAPISRQATNLPGRSEGVIGRLIWLVLWAGSAAMLVAPANRSAQSIRHQIMSAAAGEPGWMVSFQRSVAGATAGHGATIAIVLAIASLAVGIAVFLPGARKAGLVLGVLLALTYWVVGQAFGGILTGTGTDPNAGPLFVLLALALARGGVRVPNFAAFGSRIRGAVSQHTPTNVPRTTVPTS